MRIKFTYLLFIATLWPATSALANDDCLNATTSADVMRCVSQNHNTAQAELNELYKNLSLRKPADIVEGMEALQALWVDYRNRECEAETRPLESEALKRLEGIKCETRLTRERINALQRTLNAETGAAILGEPPSTQQPRWVNALSQKHPDVYWHYGGFSKGDLDCDDDAEFVIAGLRFDEGASTYKTVIAITENPATGKPSSYLMNLPALDTVNDDEEGQPVKQCSGIMSFSFEMTPEPITDAQESALSGEVGAEDSAPSVQQDTACNRRLVVKRKTSGKTAVCAPVTVFWDGRNYVIEQ